VLMDFVIFDSPVGCERAILAFDVSELVHGNGVDEVVKGFWI
jgi:hypothetical protein